MNDIRVKSSIDVEGQPVSIKVDGTDATITIDHGWRVEELKMYGIRSMKHTMSMKHTTETEGGDTDDR